MTRPQKDNLRMGVPAGHSGTWDNCPAFGAALPLERPILTAFSFLFTLLSLATVRPPLVAKACMQNPCEEIQILRGVRDTRALVGKVFFYPISPFAFQGKVTHYKVTLSNGSALPKWLTYNPNTSTLQGLAMPEEKGEYHLTVVAYGEACGPHTPTTGVNFALHVHDNVFVHQKEMGQDQNNVQNIRLCARNVSVTFAELIIHHTTNSLEIQERLYLICTMAEYLHLDPSLLTLTPFEDSFHRYLWNLTMLAEDIRHVTTVKSRFVSLYWPVGFGVFAMFYELLQVLRHTMESNHLSQLLGYEIAGWRILKQEGHEKQYSVKRLRRQLMVTPRLTPRPIKTEGLMVLPTIWLHTESVVRPPSSLLFEVTKKALPVYPDDFQSVTSEGNLEALVLQTLLNVQTKTPTVSVLQDLSTAVPELLPSLIFTSSDDFLPSVTNEGDLEVLDMQMQLNVQIKTPSSSVFLELFPSLTTSTEFEEKVTSKTPPMSQQLQSQMPQPMVYSLPKKSESKHHFVLDHFGSSMPTSTTQFSRPSHLAVDSYISSEVTPFKGTPLASFGEKIIDYGGPYAELTSGLILQDIISTARASVLPVTTLVNQKASPEFLLSRVDMSLSMSDGSYWSQDLSSNYKHAPEAYVSVLWTDNPLFTEEHSLPFAIIQTEIASWERDFSFMGIISTSGFATASRASSHKLRVPPDTSPIIPLYDNIAALAMHNTQEFNTSLFVHSIEFGLLSRTSSAPAKFLSLSLSLSTDMTIALNNISPVEELFSDWRQVSLEVSRIYENSESFLAVPKTYGYLFTKDKISALTATHIDTTLWNEQSHFTCVTSTSVPVLSTKFLSENGLFHGTSWTSTWSSYDALVFSWPTEFAGSFKSSSFASEFGSDYSSVDRTSVAYPGFSHLDTSGHLSLASSFGTKVNFQITRNLTSELMKESTIPSNKETPSQPESYATSLYHGAQGQRNTSPRIVNAIKWLTATVGHKFSFSIPPDTFYDQEDGNTTQLSLGMNPADYSPAGQGSWLQFNSYYQTMYGYPLDHDFQYSPQEFLLFATDSGGLRALDTLTIELLRPTVTPCHLYTIRTKNSYHSFLRNRRRISLFFEKLSNYLSAGGPGNMTLLHLRPGSTVIAWYNNSICARSNDQCATDEIQRVLIKLGVPGGNVNPDFVEAMLPEYKIDQIEDITYGGTCLDITKPFNESLPSNRTLSTFKDSQSWIRNILFALLISLSTTVMVILIITFHCCKYHKKVSGLQSVSSHARPFFSYVDFEMDVLKSRKPPMLDQEVPQAAQPWLYMPPPSQQHPCRPKRTLNVSRLPPPPKYRLPPSYGMEESGQSCHDHDQRRSYPKARLY